MAQDIKETKSTSGAHTARKPRGIRNNNPGNIRCGDINWQGMAADQVDTDFVCFSTPVWGLRALMKVLLTYQRTHGLKTIDAIINRWAPPLENQTAHYVWHVARCMGVSHRTKLDLNQPDVLARLARAIVRHENGAPPDGATDWYDAALYARAAGLALGFMPDAGV